MTHRFYIGTTNQHKIREIGSILHATGCELIPTDKIDPEETEPDFVGNALIKARAYAVHAGGLTISEDSGLMVAALNNLPGPWSARFSDFEVHRDPWRLGAHHPSGLSRDEIDHKNNDLVLELMRGIEQPRRAAMFKVVMIVAAADGEILFKGENEAHGWIAPEMRGQNGFGYDPIFIGHNTFDRTYAELDRHRKDLISHRRKVLNDFQDWLGRFLRQP